jgi:hypothetical protein
MPKGDGPLWKRENPFFEAANFNNPKPHIFKIEYIYENPQQKELKQGYRLFPLKVRILPSILPPGSDATTINLI